MASVPDKLPPSNAGRCTVCNCWLFYQRVDRRIGIRALLEELTQFDQPLQMGPPSHSRS
jgi:hypothetical protein